MGRLPAGFLGRLRPYWEFALHVLSGSSSVNKWVLPDCEIAEGKFIFKTGLENEVTFVSGFAGLQGGIQVITIYADRLRLEPKSRIGLNTMDKHQTAYR